MPAMVSQMPLAKKVRANGFDALFFIFFKLYNQRLKNFLNLNMP
jgi:hypothetical protein